MTPVEERNSVTDVVVCLLLLFVTSFLVSSQYTPPSAAGLFLKAGEESHSDHT